MLKRSLVAGLALAAVASVASGSAAAQDETVTLRIQHFLPAQAWVPANFIEPWAEKVTEESDGRIQFEIYPAMQLGGGPPDLYDQMVDGLVDIIWVLPGYTPGRFPQTEVFELPFITPNGETTAAALWGMYDTRLAEEYSDAHMIAIFSHGPGLVHSENPVQSLEDMAGLTVRGPTRTINWMLEELGAEAIGMPVPAVPENLSRGVIDSVVIPWEVTTALRLSELVDNHTEFTGDEALYVATMIFAMNKDVYENLPDDLKAVIDANSGLETSVWAGRVTDEGDVPGRQAAVDAGNNIYVLDAEETERWRETAQPVYDRWIEMMNEDGYDGQAIVDEARALVEENM